MVSSEAESRVSLSKLRYLVVEVVVACGSGTSTLNHTAYCVHEAEGADQVDALQVAYSERSLAQKLQLSRVLFTHSVTYKSSVPSNSKSLDCRLVSLISFNSS